MDLPVVSAVAAVGIIGGAVAFEAVAFLGAAPKTSQAPPLLANYGSSVERSDYDIPGFATSGMSGRPLSFPLIRLIDPGPAEEDASRTSFGAPQVKAAPETSNKASVMPEPSRPAPISNDVKLARLTPPEQTTVAPSPARPEQWQVIPTANASYFNRGGHINKSGVVDSLASGYLRDALKQHSRFGQLPPDIKTHILTQNIDLPKLAPYRSLLGMDDRVLEQEQAVKFVRLR